MGLNSIAFSSIVAITRPANTTAYDALDVIGRADATTAANAGNAIMEFTDMAPGGGAPIMITSADLRIDTPSVPTGMANMRLRLYKSSPTAILDNAAWDLIAGDRAAYLGYIDFGAPVDEGATLAVQAESINKQLLATSSSLFGVLQTIGGYTPASGTVYTVRLHSVRL
jgi:hypothetical protein